MPDQQRRKWDPANRKLVHIGYIGEPRAYCILHHVMTKILKAREVIFFEDQKSNSKEEKSLTETTKLEASLTPMAQSKQGAAPPPPKKKKHTHRVLKSMEIDSVNLKRRYNLERNVTTSK